ncbi:GSCFA domain-containing protein [Streptomyces sp. MST-110588]|uniref:GSCFA domain-containing protein n=1 Tax=Streptomyces sp. MST-110588 TaxID=2833628 RepID=UPI001F5D10B1|nr:GSCFA domain-containing protein [Streptomyces sp. MST-110588]UNO44368.1 GSCFA domain-containing protein [Streptomyces sp. MST-110588]
MPPRAFWRSAVAELEQTIDDLWTPKFAIGQDDPVLTAGSCFAARIGTTLLEAGMNWRDAEPAPPGLTEEERRARHYGEFSFRTGNIYTPAVLRQWLSWALGHSVPPEESWYEDGRHFDPFRPAIEPEGYGSAEEMLAARHTTLAAIRSAVAEAGCLVFTMGLTEAWQDRDGAQHVYPACPGTVRGTFDARRHVLRNFTFGAAYEDLSQAIALARTANPGLRVILTVSPQPLTATATGDHALTANTYTKSVLRAVAGQLAQEHDHIDYFPAYEIVTGIPFKSVFFGPNLRTVTPEGVAFVMRRFTTALARRSAAAPRPARTAATPTTPVKGEDSLCEDAILDYYNAG